MGRIVVAGIETTLPDFEEQVARAMAGLARLGVGEGSAVLLLLRNDTAFLVAAQAVSRLGAYPVPANWHNKPDEIAVMLRDSGARCAVAHADLARSHLAGSEVTVVSVRPPGAADAGLEGPGWIAWEALLAGSEPREVAPVPQRGALIYTSGTTSAPKAIDRAAMTPAQAAAMAESQCLTYGFRPGMKALICGPLYHSMTMSYAFTAIRTMGEDGALFVETRFDERRMLELVERERITHLLMVPVMFIRLLRLDPEERAARDVSSIEAVTHSAAPCSREVKEAMVAWWGPVLREFYGASESGPVTLLAGEDYLRKPGSVGRPMAGCTVRVLGENGAPLPAGEAGEIAVRNGSYPEFTYRHRPEERAKLDRDGLIATGDIGCLDEEGFLFLRDCKKDMIITGGVNVYPAEIEGIILERAEVRDCAVFGIPDAEFGESMAAHIELCAGVDPDMEAMRRHLADRLAKYKIPKVIHFTEGLPRDDNGKIAKRHLAAPYWADQGRRP
ncbi:AMP-binding protein [Roseomonas sp. OT10]|uniref:AMP-binding protein n=1 Tax=Roseomonas cutis TaxID=2897332 RepID=UPI001E40531F|nr:AMP-binding protein [Roseomonas sp. OT10]UFN50104.1 AMP-binding protein [Roseomonas sp. OT10]